MKKIFIAFLLSIIFMVGSYAMPGFNNYLPDNSGEYVYYRDYTFTRESYIGILYYDDSTFQIRYAAPKSQEFGKPEKEIALLVSVNPESAHFEMTGERIISTILPNEEDTDIVNYLHDILYEFNYRRAKMDVVTQQELIVPQEYPQFGDGVSITFDAKIPLFNIRKISNIKGEVVFDCATIGQLTSSSDKSFSNFYGFPLIEASNKVYVPVMPAISSKKHKQQKPIKYKFEKQIIHLDDDWEQKMENFWTLRNESLVTVSQIPVSNQDRKLNELFLLRKFLENSENTYCNLITTEISYNERKYQYKIKSKIYQADSKNYVINTKILTSQQPKKGFISDSSTVFDYFSMSTYESAYTENPTYFDKVVRNYRCN